MLLRRSAVALGLLLLGSCSGNGSSPDAGADAGMDAGRDGGRRDLGIDSGRDAGTDARVADAGLADMGLRDGGPPEPAGWVPLPGLPAGCVIERAEHPETVYSPSWLPCEGADGCQRLAPPEPGTLRVFGRTEGWHDGERGYFMAIQGGERDGRRILLLADTEGRTLAAWSGPNDLDDGVCSASSVEVRDGHAAMLVRVSIDGERQGRLYFGPIDVIGRLAEPAVVLGPDVVGTSNVLQRMAVSATTVAMELQPAGIVVVVEGERMDLLRPTASVPGIPQVPIVVGQNVLWSAYGSPVTIAHGGMDRPAELFYGSPGADVVGFDTDGIGVAWVQLYADLGPDGLPRRELWTASYVEDPADLRPRRLLPFADVERGVVGGGVYASRRVAPDGSIQRLLLHDLADGNQRTFTAPRGYAILENPIYVTTDELLVMGNDGEHVTLFRIDLRALPRTSP